MLFNITNSLPHRRSRRGRSAQWQATQEAARQEQTRREHRLDRDHTLSYAARLTTDRAKPASVITHAAVLLAWLEAAHDEHDREARRNALTHAHCCRGFAHDPDDDPDALISEATAYYAFLTSTPDQPATPESGPSEPGPWVPAA